ncbi:onanonoxo-7-onima-8-eninoihtemlysoneda [Cladophialophora carrionii]|uniref:Onanonoxo-7-onima-8-eninoihtemlysoneda n=1 Tax=Cladophialophora carrionii TaxID=86049 RepID=A0A1C1CE90_9EURO|nr:onanonoxo-7-onima-8-eninoihtemlysoneda [Cladophialophora carrionii]
MLWRDLRAWQVFGANTNVGKTILSTLLCRALQNRPESRVPTLYLKPVSTGPENEADVGHIGTFVPGVGSKNISQFSRPLSPHLAAELDKDSSVPRSDASILSRVKSVLTDHATAGGRYALVETAGGVLSPGPSGTVQADLYRPLRLPTILVGDSKLGGIATTISAFESLHIRGYDVDSIVLFNDPDWGNFEYLEKYFRNHDIPTYALPQPPPKHESPVADKDQLRSYYADTANGRPISALFDHLRNKHYRRVSQVISMPSHAEQVIWHPFRQHGIAHNITAIDSAYDDHFQTYIAKDTPEQDFVPGLKSLEAENKVPQSLLTPLFDASASWWTQGLGHGNSNVALTAAHAAGRYGHVMFAHSVHQPALDISYSLLETLQNPRLSRIFFTDNGSTGMEVAVKMALRASCARYGWTKDDVADKPVEILGLKGSYHGDTIGAMNCSEPSVFNEKVDWHRPWGHWFDPPSLLFKKGKWELTVPAETSPAGTSETQTFDSMHSIFDFDARADDATRYKDHITRTLQALVRDQHRRFGALVLEPLLMGAGGMIFVDPLFQRTLIKTIRENPGLIHPSETGGGDHDDDSSSSTDWSGVPVIADEVFTGLYRLGRASSSSFLSKHVDGAAATQPDRGPPSQPSIHVAIAPDISVHAKLLTAGLLPLAITTASDPIFQTFLSADKTDALLHGHSYTAHPVGCSVATKALAEYRKLDETPTSSSSSSSSTTTSSTSWQPFKQAWAHSQSAQSTDETTSSSPPALTKNDPPPAIYSFFPPTLVDTLSHHPRLSGCFALGTVLVLKMAPSRGSQAGGYTSTAAAALQERLLTLLDEEGCGIHSRVLGDVIYFMASLTTSAEQIGRVGRMILKGLDMEVGA